MSNINQKILSEAENDKSMVIVRCYGGHGRVRTLLTIGPTGAWVCSPDRAGEIRAGRALAPIAGFPLADVFQFDSRAAAMIEAGESPNWEELRLLRDHP